MRLTVAIALACVCGLPLAVADPANAAARKETYIPAEGLSAALQTLATQYDFQVLYRTEIVQDLKTKGASGSLSPGEALGQVLTGTGLSYKYLDAKTVTVYPSTPADIAPPANTSGGGAQEGKKSTSGIFRLAQAGQGQAASAVSVANQTAAQTQPSELSEIVVTAQKRSENAMDVPMSITALSGEQLLRAQSFRLEDFVGKVPGLTLIEDGGLGSQLVIRGVSSGVLPINSSVATYIDETPYTSEGPFAAGFILSPNLDTFDMQRIEVLRGPQGTLYGSNALGGILKYVTNAPDPSGFKATVETGASSVNHGGTGFDAHAMVNLPISSDAALRVVGYDDYYPGFIDDPSRGATDINGIRIKGGRASLLYEPTANFSIRFNAQYQDRSWDDFGNEDVSPGTLRPVFGNLIQEQVVSQPGHATTHLYNVTMNWDAGFAKLISATSYYNFQPTALYNRNTLNATISNILGTPTGVAVALSEPVQAITQELRLSSPDNQALQWQIGGYFTNESANENEAFLPANPTTHTIEYNSATNIGDFLIPVHYKERAAFANLDYHFTETFDVSAGGRYSDNDQKFHETGTGLLGGHADFGNTSSENVVTYSGDIRWHFVPDSMLYARVATGFVPGGPNDAIAGATLSATYKSSTTTNYEVGIKSSLLDRRVTVELTAFDIDWHDIQLTAVVGGLNTITNGGTARSDGLEWNFSYLPITGLTLNLNGAYTDARLTQPTPASVNGKTGDRLPGVPLFAMAAGAEYRRPLFADYFGFAGLDWRFTGSRYADFVAGNSRQIMPSYDIFDLRAGVETQRYTVALYAKNVANKIAINYVQPEALGRETATVYQPRTLGVTLTARF